ncbi:MAG TPA: hypothetical protein VGO80_10365 [Solirubrobacteraceae bacterium]|nr:hypothetical protein [Solirubrobacteraceae bacterium]
MLTVQNVGQLTVRSDRDGVLHTIRVEGELDLADAEDLELRRVERMDALSIVQGLCAWLLEMDRGAQAVGATRTAPAS